MAFVFAFAAAPVVAPLERRRPWLPPPSPRVDDDATIGMMRDERCENGMCNVYTSMREGNQERSVGHSTRRKLICDAKVNKSSGTTTTTTTRVGRGGVRSSGQRRCEYRSFRTSTRLGGCTGDLRSCANVPSMGDPTLFLNVVLCLFWQHQFGSKGKNPGGRCFMGAARQNWPFPPRAYKGVRTSARP